MIDETTMEDLVAALGAGSDETREQAADSVTDLTRSYSPEQALRLVAALAEAAAAERSPSAREAQLHAASELVEWHPGARAAAAAVASIDPARVSASETEYLEYLTEAAG